MPAAGEGDKCFMIWGMDTQSQPIPQAAKGVVWFTTANGLENDKLHIGILSGSP